MLMHVQCGFVLGGAVPQTLTRSIEASHPPTQGGIRLRKSVRDHAPWHVHLEHLECSQ